MLFPILQARGLGNPVAVKSQLEQDLDICHLINGFINSYWIFWLNGQAKPQTLWCNKPSWQQLCSSAQEILFFWFGYTQHCLNIGCILLGAFAAFWPVLVYHSDMHVRLPFKINTEINPPNKYISALYRKNNFAPNRYTHKYCVSVRREEIHFFLVHISACIRNTWFRDHRTVEPLHLQTVVLPLLRVSESHVV